MKTLKNFPDSYHIYLLSSKEDTTNLNPAVHIN